MGNPFDTLKKTEKEDTTYDEWGGQFACSTQGCHGWANVARYFPKLRRLAWQCQDGHISQMGDVDE